MDAVHEGPPQPQSLRIIPVGADYMRLFLKNPSNRMDASISFKQLQLPAQDPYLYVGGTLAKRSESGGNLIATISTRHKNPSNPKLPPFDVGRFTGHVNEGVPLPYLIEDDKKGVLTIRHRHEDVVSEFVLDQSPIRTILRYKNLQADAHLEEIYDMQAKLLQATIQTYFESANLRVPGGDFELIPLPLERAKSPDVIVDLRDEK